MEIYTIERPSLLPAGCALSGSRLPIHESFVVTAADRAWLPQAHQVRIQAELARTLATVDGSYGTTGFVGTNGTDLATKRMTDGASGVPPRGRPV